MNSERLIAIISIIGKDRIEKVYDITRGEKVSFATLYKQILLDHIKERIESGQSFKQIAKDCNVCRMTVYRAFRQLLKENKRNQKIVTANIIHLP